MKEDDFRNPPGQKPLVLKDYFHYFLQMGGLGGLFQFIYTCARARTRTYVCRKNPPDPPNPPECNQFNDLIFDDPPKNGRVGRMIRRKDAFDHC